MNEKFHIITFGCQMNRADSERISSYLRNLGMVETYSPEQADLVVINSCMVRQMAEDRVYGRVKNLDELKKQKPNFTIAVTGCMPGQDREGKLKNKMPGVDLYFPISELPGLGQKLKERGFLINNVNDYSEYLNISPQSPNTFHSYIVLSTGCSQYCTYCVVPYARGEKKDRPLKQILLEAKQAAEKGVVWLTLLGQIVNHYQAPDPENFSAKNPFNNQFAKLLWEVNQINGIERTYWTSPDPLFMDDEVIEAMKLPKQINYLHMPVQAGSNRILKKMNRGYTREEYIEVIKKVRQIKPDIAITTDIIVGFPGETEEDFKESLSLYEELDFDFCYPAMYSPRPGTVAARFYADNIEKAEKKRRWQELERLMEKITLKKNKKYAGKKVKVIVENYKDGFCWGRSNEMKLVKFSSGRDLTGRIITVNIESPETWHLGGKVI